jgi:hypothetical protein
MGFGETLLTRRVSPIRTELSGFDIVMAQPAETDKCTKKLAGPFSQISATHTDATSDE